MLGPDVVRLGRGSQRLEHLRPGVRARTGESFQRGCNLGRARVIAERLGERDQRLLAVIEFARVDTGGSSANVSDLVRARRLLVGARE